MTWMPTPLRRALATSVAAASILVLGGASPAGAQPAGASCPASVDTAGEGWICMLLVLQTPTSSPSDQQIGLWEGIVNTDGRAAVANGITFSDVATQAKVTTLYEAELGRSPEPEGLNYWTDVMQTNRSELPVEFNFFRSGEYLSQFESVEAFINDQYRYFLGREAALEERRYWADLFIEDDRVSNEQLTWAIGSSREAGVVRLERAYDTLFERSPTQDEIEARIDRAASLGYFKTLAELATTNEAIGVLGQRGLCLSPAQDC